MISDKIILVVDDSDVDRFICSEIIKRTINDIRVIEAVNGENALEILKELGDKPDIILLDLNMPKMDGFEFLEAYSREQNQCESSIMMLTSSLFEDDVERAKEYKNVKEFISKPLLKDHAKLLEKYLGKDQVVCNEL